MNGIFDELVADWPGAFILGEPVVGGKGWNLARLHRYGLPVPAFDRLFEANRLRPLLKACSDCQTDAVREVSARGR